MKYKSVLSAVVLAFAGSAFASPNETFEGASQAGSRYFAHEPLGLVDYGNGNVRYTASWAKGIRFVAVMRHGQPALGQPDVGGHNITAPVYGQLDLAVHNITAPVPEPETYALMLGGLLVVAAVVRRRKTR